MVGFDEFAGPESVVLIEWADKVASVLKNINCININISHIGRTSRKFHFANIPAHIDL